MNNCDVFEQMQNMSSMYLASNKELQCNTHCGIDIRDIRLFEVTNQTYDTISKNLYAIENILDAMHSQNVTYVYLIQGTGTEIHYYYGVAPLLNTKSNMSDIPCEIQQGEDIFVANFEVNYPGSSIAELTTEEKQTLHRELLREQSCAVLEGVPGVTSSSSTTLGMDRFVNVMEQEAFLVMVLAQPLSENKVNEIVCDQQAVLDMLAPLLDFSKTKQESSVNEVSGLLDKNRANTTSRSNTSSEQLLFQFFTSGSDPLKFGSGSLQQIENLFFKNGVANTELIELMDNLCIHPKKMPMQKSKHISRDTSQQKVEERSKEASKEVSKEIPKEVSKDTKVTPSVDTKQVVTTQEITSQEVQNNIRSGRRRNPFGIPLMNRINQNTKQPSRRPVNSTLGAKTKYKITEDNVVDVGDKIIRFLDNSDRALDVTKEDRNVLRIQQTILDEEDLILGDVEGIEAELLEGQKEFTLSSFNRQDSRANSKVKSCSTNNRLAVSNRDACTNICSVTERYTNQAVTSWNRYLIDIVNSRLLYGENRGIYVYSTIVFARNESKLTKVAAAWKGMNEYNPVSKVPITETILYQDMNQYNNVVNFQIPKYFYGNNTRILSIPYEEVLARSAYSQFVEYDYIYGGNWISSKELRYMVTLPSKSTISTFISREEADNRAELTITSVNKSSFPNLDRKKMRHGAIIIGDRHSGREETLKNILFNLERPFTLLEFDSGRYSKMFKGTQRIERYPVLMSAGKTLKINPFELFPDELIDNHVELFLAMLIHCYRFNPMLVDLIGNAIYDSYVTYGWNLDTNNNDKYGKLAYTKEVKAFPTFSDILLKTEEIIKKQIKEKDLQLKCLSRARDALNGWTIGKKGTLLDAELSVNLTALMEQSISIELEELVNEADRKFFSLLYIWRCMAMRKSQGRMDSSNHIIVMEDIGRILGKGSGAITPWEENAVETIVEYLVTSMKYGESIVLIEEGVSSLPKNIRSELYAVFMHQITSLNERRDLVQWLNIKKRHQDLLSDLKPKEYLCMTRDNQEIYECKL